MVYFFGLLNLVKLVPYFALGQFTPGNLSTTLILIPIAPLSVLIGVRLVRHFSQQDFLPDYLCSDAVDRDKALLGQPYQR